MRKRLLLCLSDSPIASLCHGILASHDYEIEIANTQNECCVALRARPPALLVLDHDMSWGSSKDILTLLRSDVSLERIGVILIAPGYMSPDQIAQLLVYPVLATLQRPIHPEKLLGTLRFIEDMELRDKKR